MSTPTTALDFLRQAGPDEFLDAMRTFTDGLGAEEYLACLGSDFRFFLWELWKDRKLNRFAPLDRGELDIANYAQHGPKKRGVMAPRGVGKTNFGTAALSCFRLRRDRDRRILIPSKNEDAMKETISLIKGWMNTVWFLEDLNPNEGKSLRDDGKNCRDTTTYFDVAGCKENKQPSVKCIGLTGQMEGNRAHSIFPDDVETKQNTKTLEARSELARLLKETTNILYPDLPDQDDPDNELLRPIDPTEVVFWGTIKHEDTVYAKLDGQRTDDGKKTYHFMTWTLAYPTPEEIRGALNISPMILDDLATGRKKPGDPMFPRRFGHDNIAEKKAEGYQEFAMEHQLQVTLARTNRYPLRLSDLIVMDVPPLVAPATVVYGQRDSSGSTAIQDIPLYSINASDALYRPAFISPASDWFPYHGTKAFIDPAGRGTDETGVSVVSSLGSLLFCRGNTGFAGGMDPTTIDSIILYIKSLGATEIYIEGNIDAFGTYIQNFESRLRMFFEEPSPLFPNGWKASVTEHRSSGQKEVRIIETLEPVISTHRLIMDRGVITPNPTEEPHQSLQYQLSRITRERNCIKLDDRIDSLANCVFQWNHILRNSARDINSRMSESAAIDAAAEKLRRLAGLHEDSSGPSFLTAY